MGEAKIKEPPPLVVCVKTYFPQQKKEKNCGALAQFKVSPTLIRGQNQRTTTVGGMCKKVLSPTKKEKSVGHWPNLRFSPTLIRGQNQRITTVGGMCKSLLSPTKKEKNCWALA